MHEWVCTRKDHNAERSRLEQADFIGLNQIMLWTSLQSYRKDEETLTYRSETYQRKEKQLRSPKGRS